MRRKWATQWLKPIGDAIAGVIKWFGGLNPTAQLATVGIYLFAKMLPTLAAAAGAAGRGLGLLAQSIGKAGLVAGAALVINQIADAFDQIKQNQQDVTDQTNTLTAALVANGGQWNNIIREQQVASIAGMSQFQTLIKVGASYGDAMDFLTGKTNNFGKILKETNGNYDVASLIQWAIGMNKSGDIATRPLSTSWRTTRHRPPTLTLRAA